jgi:hypothetical protein
VQIAPETSTANDKRNKENEHLVGPELNIHVPNICFRKSRTASSEGFYLYKIRGVIQNIPAWCCHLHSSCGGSKNLALTLALALALELPVTKGCAQCS